MPNKILVEKLYLAKPRGYCAGVVMAIEAVENAAKSTCSKAEGDLIVYHNIVHNNTVVKRLQDQHNVQFVEDLNHLEKLNDDLNKKGRFLSDTVVFSAHGISPLIHEQAAKLHLETIDATCPLVQKVHAEAKKFAREGFHILLIGDSTKHQEIIGTKGEAPNATTVVSFVGNTRHDPDLANPYHVVVPNPDKVVVLTQTTLSVDDVAKTIDILKERFPGLVVPHFDDLCYATKNRQDAVRNIAPNVDLFLIVTCAHSSNGMRLLELAQEIMGNSKRVESVKDIAENWLYKVSSVGISSAASTPDDLVQEIVTYFKQYNPQLDIIEEGNWEDIVFHSAKRIPSHT